MTVPEGTTRAWGARVTISVSIHIPYLSEETVKAAVEARLAAATAAAVWELTRGPNMLGSYAAAPESSVGVTQLHMRATGTPYPGTEAAA